MEKHEHAELIKAWADGSEIQHYKTNSFTDWKHETYPKFYSDEVYRIHPNCEYAIEKIRELGGDEAVEVYKYWLDGGIIECRNNCYMGTNVPFAEKAVSDDPLRDFKFYLTDCQINKKKKQTVKQVLWVYYREDDPNIENSFLWLHENYPFIPDGWHKVPTCTREVEV